MIEINLVPDVKQELIRAERVRSIVITLAILSGAVAVGVVVLLAMWVFLVQAGRGLLSDNAIKKESEELLAVQDIESTLTIQNQLNVLTGLHENKYVKSRVFDVLATINPPAPNTITISKLTVDSVEKTMSIEAQSVGGYAALEVFKKTILATEFRYGTGGDQAVALASNMSDGERSYGEAADGSRVLRFGLTFNYADELFSPYLADARIVGPGTANVTDSFLGIPKSLFSERAEDAEGSN